MNILDKLAWWWVTKRARLNYGNAFPNPWGEPPSWKTEDYIRAYGEIGWIFACVLKIATAVAEADWYVYTQRGDDKVELDEHPLVDLLYRGNPFQTGFEFRELSQAYIDLAGEVFWVIERDGLKVPRELYAVNPTRMRVATSKQKYIAGYVYTNGTERIPLPVEDVIHIKLPNPINPYRGLGPVQAAALAADIDKYAGQHARNFFYNDATPGGVIEVQGILNEEQFRRLQKQWTKEHKGVDKAHRVGILEGGAKFNKLDSAFKDLGVLELRKFSRDEILTIYGVPLPVLGIVEDVNRANAEAGDYTFARWVVRPRLRRIREAINEFLAPQFDEKIWVDFDDPVPENREQMLKETETGLKSGYMTVNEARQRQGLDPVEGGDVFYIPVSAYPAPTPDGGGGEGSPGDDTKAALKKKIAARVKSISDDDRWAAFVRRTEGQERAMVRVLKKLFQGQQDEVNQKLRELEKEALDQLRARVAEAATKELPPIDVELLLFDREEWNEKFAQEGEKFHRQAIETAGKAAFAELGLEISFDLLNPRVTDWLRREKQRFARQVNETTWNQLKESLIEGLEAGEGIPELSDRVSAVMTLAKNQRAPTIARTEIIKASKAGALEGYRQSGVVVRKRWISARDERTRRPPESDFDHVAADGEEVGLESYFNRTGEPLIHPGDPNGSPGNIINCRCTMGPVVEV